MIGTMLRCTWLNLKRDRVVLLLTFVLPVAFFSIFASIFAGMAGGGGAMSNVKVAVVDEDRSDSSTRLVEALRADASLDVSPGPAGDPQARYDRAAAEALVRKGTVRVAIVIPPGFGAGFMRFGGESPKIELLADSVADPVAPQMVAGLLQRDAMTAAPDLLAERGLDQFDRYIGLTPEQKDEVGKWLAAVRSTDDGPPAGAGAPAGPAADVFGGFIGITTTDVQAPRAAERRAERSRIVAFYAAATGVMFLLFSMTGAAGALLEEHRTGTLERLLNANFGIGRLVASYWLAAALVGFLQLSVMFIWGWAVFGLDLWTVRHVSGFVAMTAVSCAAASAFGLMLGTACRSEGQLRGLSTIVILVMSAVGGSMFPRFMMPPAMQKAGLATFNGWALDGYRKVFHLDEPLWALWPQLAVLAAMAAAFLMIARLLARRWEAV